MKLIFIINLSIIMGIFTFSNAFATDKSDCIYRSKIDQTISFYQGRLYLIDSKHKILSDIGKDAQKMINYLQGRKEQLVKEMKNKEIDLQSIKMRTYIVNKARISDVGLGYTKP